MRAPFLFVVVFDALFKIVGRADIQRTIGAFQNIGEIRHVYLYLFVVKTPQSLLRSILSVEDPDERSEEGLRDLDSNQDLQVQSLTCYQITPSRNIKNLHQFSEFFKPGGAFSLHPCPHYGLPT